jgi:putative ABC transport system substrate-binding protein
MVVAVTTLVILVSAISAHAQQEGKVWRIGYLTPAPYIWPTFRSGLRELGYVAGKNFTIEFRQRKRPKTYVVLAKELVALKVDVILAVGAGAARAAKQVTTTIPIVMGNSSTDPVRQGLIDSLARPGGNVTGMIDLLPDLAGKRVELLKEIFPKLSRIAHLGTGGSGSRVTAAHLKKTLTAARGLGVQVQALNVKSPGDLESAFRAASEGGAEAAIVVGVGFFIPHRPRIVKLAAKYRLPTMHTHTARWVRLGGLIGYATDVNLRYRRAAQYVDKIFKGAKPADLPVQQARKFSLEINLKTAKALGIKVPPSILLRATEVIE